MSNDKVFLFSYSKNDNLYTHYLILKNDIVEVCDKDNKIIFTFDSNCTVFDKNKNIIGRIKLETINGISRWVYHSEDESVVLVCGFFDNPDDLIENTEKIIAMHYLSK